MFGAHERDRRWHVGACTPAVVVATNLIAYLKIIFMENNFKASHRQWSEALNWAKWISRNELDRLEEAHGMLMSEGSLTTNEGLH